VGLVEVGFERPEESMTNYSCVFEGFFEEELSEWRKVEKFVL
jgi:hypothetical protein